MSQEKEASNQDIQKQIDTAVKSLDVKSGEFLEKQILNLRNVLSRELQTLEMGYKEWHDIYATLVIVCGKDVLEKFHLSDGLELREFVLLNRKPDYGLTPADIERIAKEYSDANKLNGLASFLGKYEHLLSPRELGDVLHKMVVSEKVHCSILYYHLNLFALSPKCKDICLGVAAHYPIAAFEAFGEYRKHPFAFDVIKIAIKNAGLWDFSYIEKVLTGKIRSQIPSAFSQEQVRELLNDVKIYHSQQETAHAMVNNHVFPEVKEFLSDPALKKLFDIKKEWILGYFKNSALDDTKVYRLQILVARNLFFTHKQISEHNVKQALSEMLSERASHENTPLFQGRNVVVGAHSESKKGAPKENRFGNDEILMAIRSQGGSVEHFRPNSQTESLQAAKENMLKAIEVTKPPFTFLFDGHGGPSAIYLSDGEAERGVIHETSQTVKITVQELAQAYIRRLSRFPALKSEDGKKRDIMMFNSCYNHTFMREFYALVESGLSGAHRSGICLPITIGASEYGQLAFDSDSKYGSSFAEGVLALGKNGISTLKDVFLSEDKQQDSIASCYIPKKTILMQIAKNQVHSGDDQPWGTLAA